MEKCLWCFSDDLKFLDIKILTAYGRNDSGKWY